MRLSGMQPATVSEVGQVNQTAIIEALRTHGPMSKPQLHQLTGLSPATINRLTLTLQRDGILVRRGVEASSGGRPPILLAIDGDALMVLAFQVRSDRVTGALVDYEGSIAARLEQSIPDSAHGGIRALRALAHELERTAVERGTPVRAVGIALAGVADSQGQISGLAGDRWAELTVSDLHSITTSPISIENDANALAIGELYRGRGGSSSHFVALLLDTGLGAGIVVNGAPYHGAHSAAGEIGYLLVDTDSLTRSTGESGDLESRIGPAFIASAAEEAGIVEPGQAVTAMSVITRAQDGDPRARPLADHILDELARAVAAIGSILDPEYIILGGGLQTSADDIAVALSARLTGRIQHVPPFVGATLGNDAVILGAAEAAVRALGGLPVRAVPRADQNLMSIG